MKKPKTEPQRGTGLSRRHFVSNNTGTKGIGEPATIPSAAAIANAFYHATGVRVTAAPLTTSQIVTLLAERNKRG